MKILQSFLCHTLAFQMIWTPFSVPSSYASEDQASFSHSEQSREQRKIESVIQSLETSASGEYPTGKSPDPFRLTQQNLLLPDGKIFELSRLNSNLPELTVVDFDQEITIEQTQQGLTFALSRKGKFLGSHIISGVEALSMARDQELLVFLDSDGKYRAIDLVYVRSAIFKGPIPVFELKSASLPQHAALTDITLEYLTRHTLPTSGESGMDRVWTAGDILVRNAKNPESIAETLPRDVIQMQIYTAEATLGMLAFTVAPDEQSGKISPLVLSLQKNAEILENTQKQLESARDPWVSRALGAFSSQEVQKLIARAAIQKSSSQQLRDRFTLAEWSQDFLKASDNSLPPSELDQVKPSQFLHAQLSPLRLRRIAAWTLGTAIACAATYCGVHALADTQGVAWATRLINEAYPHLWPEVLKDEAYRVTLLKSSLALSSAIPIYWAVSALTAKTRNKEDWNFKKELGVWSMRFSAAIQLPFFHRLAKLTRQPNFLKAMRMGINPFSRIELSDGSGKKSWVGLNSMIGDLEAREKEIQAKSHALEDLRKSKSAEHRMAWALALAAVSERSGIDPATLTLLSEKGEWNSETLNQILQDPKTTELWKQTADELFYQIEKMNTQERGQIQTVRPELIQKYYAIARETAEKIENRSAFAKTATRLKLKWRQMGAHALKFIGAYGLEEYHFLKQVEPTQFIADQTWKQFTVDYLLAVGQMGLFGARADLKNPEHLAADPNGLLWTTPGHLTDMLDQVRIYGLNVPASFALVYMKAKSIQETRYLPVEMKELAGKTTQESFLKGMWTWIQGASHLEKADYGHLWMKGLIKTLRTIQGNILLLIPFRLILGGQGIVDAASGFLLSVIWANWQYGWIWSPINRGNQIYEEDREALNQKLADAKVRISQGLRLNDSLLLQEGYQKLQSLYPDEDALPKNTPLTGVSEMDELRTNAQELLQHSLENPPFSTAVNSKVGWVTTMFGALSTTYLAASLSVATFQTDADWGPILGKAAILSASLYVGTYLGQKLINRSAQRLREIRSQHGGLFPYAAKRLADLRGKCANLLSVKK